MRIDLVTIPHFMLNGRCHKVLTKLTIFQGNKSLVSFVSAYVLPASLLQIGET